MASSLLQLNFFFFFFEIFELQKGPLSLGKFVSTLCLLQLFVTFYLHIVFDVTFIFIFAELILKRMVVELNTEKVEGLL